MNNFKKARPLEVLIVEDNPGDVRLTKECLKDFRVDNNLHVVQDGEEAIDFLRKGNRFSRAPKKGFIHPSGTSRGLSLRAFMAMTPITMAEMVMMVYWITSAHTMEVIPPRMA